MSTAATQQARSSFIAPEWALIGFLWFCYLLNQADRQVVYTLFPALQQTFGYSNAVLGLTGALFLWVYGLCSPLAGILGDRFPKPLLVVGALVIWSILTVLSGLSPNGGFLLGCRGLLGISESFFMPAAYAMMAAAHGPATRSRAIAIFGTSQILGVATGGSISAFIAEKLNWRVSFWLLGGIGILFAIPLIQFFRHMPRRFSDTGTAPRADLKSFLVLFRIPMVRILTIAVAVGTFGLFLVYTWLPTFLFDKFKIGLAHAGFEASVYPQIGTGLGLLTGGWLADHYNKRIRSSRFWVIVVALTLGAPCIFLLSTTATLQATRLASIAVGFFAGFVNANQAAALFDVVPVTARASGIGVLNFVAAIVSGFAPFLGGIARSTIGVDRLMAFSGGLYISTAAILVYGIMRHFEKDKVE